MIEHCYYIFIDTKIYLNPFATKSDKSRYNVIVF